MTGKPPGGKDEDPTIRSEGECCHVCHTLYSVKYDKPTMRNLCNVCWAWQKPNPPDPDRMKRK